ncbi:hypothetical protein RC74_10860 [Falsihalocynthiibacter arcticus]|uniref:Uncharacterized protein n=1 Tax=Falsihalocynthiibacter arcticus TaxID=1579316 RepID=A0A126V1E5_9RHOB|nr:hypothetical protein RC74_10860 [Falsihalocynthiibacter arcticus]
MPNSKINTPAWNDFASTLIERLRHHHGAPSDASHTPSDLDELFTKFESGKDVERFGQVTRSPLRYVPARQVLIAIRLAATFKSPTAIDIALQCGALTVVRDIGVVDLTILKDVLSICFPRAPWQILAPDIVDGALSKNAQARLASAITDSFDLIEPVLIMQTHGLSLPKHLTAMVPPVFPMAPICGDVLATLLHSGHLSDQITDPVALRAALPHDDVLSGLETVTACAALRAPTLQDALIKLNAITKRDVHSTGPRLEDMTGDTLALSAARRIVDDLKLWKAGKAGWDEISRSLLLYGPPAPEKPIWPVPSATARGSPLSTPALAHGNRRDIWAICCARCGPVLLKHDAMRPAF